MKRNKVGFALFILAGIFLAVSVGHPADEQLKAGHRVLNVTVTEIKGDALFFKTEEGTTRNVALKIVEKYEKVGKVKVGDQLVMEFNEGNEVIRISRPGDSPEHFTVSGQVVEFDPMAKKVTLKLTDGTTKSYNMIPPASIKMAAVPKGSTVVLDIDSKNNFVKDFERGE
jgi:hypothetical protein